MKNFLNVINEKMSFYEENILYLKNDINVVVNLCQLSSMYDDICENDNEKEEILLIKEEVELILQKLSEI